jgi:PKD domain
VCNDIWRFLIEQKMVIAIWTFVVEIWQFCAKQFWLWGFFCVALAVFATVFAIGITIVSEVAAVIALILCELACIVLNIGPHASAPMCFDASKHPSNQTPSAPPAAALAVSAGGPYRGTIDVPVSMNATVYNQPLPSGASIAWDFGDGAKASGASVSHAYSTPQQFTVKVSVLGQTLVGIGPLASDSTTALIVGEGSFNPNDIG